MSHVCLLRRAHQCQVRSRAVTASFCKELLIVCCDGVDAVAEIRQSSFGRKVKAPADKEFDAVPVKKGSID